MSVITTLLSSDALEPTSRQNINTNFANLNADKQEKPVGAVTNNIVLFGASNVLVDSGKGVPAGTIVGTTDAQALTNKDLSSTTNTFPATLVTTTGVQTLTNKTLTSPVISDFTNAGHNHQNAAGGGTLDGSVIATGTVPVARLPVMVASGASHAAGIAPDPGAVAGTTKFLREDGTWQAPASGGDYVFLATATLNPGAAIFTISGLSTAAYSFLDIEVIFPTMGNVVITLQFNGDTALHYQWAYSQGGHNGQTNAFSTGDTKLSVGPSPNGGGTSGKYMRLRVQNSLMGTTNVHTLSGMFFGDDFFAGTSGFYLSMFSGNWTNAATSITSITLNGGTMPTGTVIRVYGIT